MTVPNAELMGAGVADLREQGDAEKEVLRAVKLHGLRDTLHQLRLQSALQQLIQVTKIGKLHKTLHRYRLNRCAPFNFLIPGRI